MTLDKMSAVVWVVLDDEIFENSRPPPWDPKLQTLSTFIYWKHAAPYWYREIRAADHSLPIYIDLEWFRSSNLKLDGRSHLRFLTTPRIGPGAENFENVFIQKHWNHRSHLVKRGRISRILHFQIDLRLWLPALEKNQPKINQNPLKINESTGQA